MTTVQRAYKYRFYPTTEQAEQLARTFGCARYVYNHFLRLRTDAWYERQERIGYTDTAKLLTALKKEPETAWLQEVSNAHMRAKALEVPVWNTVSQDWPLSRSGVQT